jgi:dihydroorotate dehydrogenase
MPDWSYQPLLRPLLFRLPAERGRDLTLRATATLGKLPLGLAMIEVFGNMHPSSELQRTALGITFAGPVGLGADLDPHAIALRGLARFGFGYLEIGPVTEAPLSATASIERRPEQEAIWYPAEPVNDGLEAILRQVERAAPLPIPLGIRLGHRPGASAQEATRERCQMALRLQRFAAFFTLETQGAAANGTWSTQEWSEHLDGVVRTLASGSPPRPLLLCLAPDLDWECVQALLAPAVVRGVSGVVVTGGVHDGPHGRLVGVPARDVSVALVEALHRAWGEHLTIIGGDGIQEPADALRVLAAGATLVQVDSGLVYAGPGLPKRINEAVAFYRSLRCGVAPSVAGASADPAGVPPRRHRPNQPHPSRLVRERWFWMALLGASMIVGGMLACLIAVTVVVLPYDEAFVGLLRPQLAAINPRLLSFMTHDRVSLAGVMIAIGVLYWQMAVFGIRRGAHWAWRASLISAVVGFASFFLFLGFGYFDPLHAGVSVILLCFLVLALRGRVAWQYAPPVPDLRNDRAWHLSLWGQGVLVVLGVGLMGAGVVIASIGVTQVFVPEDLEFLHTTAAALHAANPHLVALIAHDRAGLGGALVSAGLAVLLAALWGFRRGNRWLWWMWLCTGTPAIAAALSVHLIIGYTNLFHLAPVLALLVLFVLALALSYPYLCRTEGCVTLPTDRRPPADARRLVPDKRLQDRALEG